MSTAQRNVGGFAPFTNTTQCVTHSPGRGDVQVPMREPLSERGRTPGRRALRVLIVDDDRALREGCASALRIDGYEVVVLSGGTEALEMIQRARFDLMLVDVGLSPVSGFDILRAVMSGAPSTLVVLMTGNPNVGSSIEAMQLGAWDYLSKPYSGTQLQLLLGRASHIVSTRQQEEQQSRADDSALALGAQLPIFGSAPVFRQAIELARKVAATTASVMIVGETGTGKELLAQCVHRYSRRARQAMVPVNCAAIPEQLLESEMFGHRKGSFTGADRDKTGLLEMAHGGTIFLDELTEMPLSLQAKMLRVIQDGVVRRVGSEHEDAVVDVRFISATNRDPREAIRERKLREDLYYRLNVVQVTLPALRDRPEDIPLLANHFLKLFWARHRSPKAELPVFDVDAMDFITSRPWPGNVRELQNFIEHIAVLAQPGSKIRVQHLPLEQHMVVDTAAPAATQASMNEAYHISKEQVLATFEKEYVTRLVARASGNMSRAARLACVDRTTLYRLLERHGFRRESEEHPMPPS